MRPVAPGRDDASPSRLPLAIACVSAGALAYQLLLMRWLAIAHWYPFAAMIISLALLGHGASGTWLGLCLERARTRFGTWFPACALAFALTSAAVLPLAAHIPFNGLELVWNPRQLGWLSLLYLVLALPFFFAASCFGLAFARFGASIPRLYGADLLGAGTGALLGLALMALPLSQAMVAAAACGVLAAGLTSPRRNWPLPMCVVGALVLLMVTHRLEPPDNAYKGLARVQLLPRARVLWQDDSAYGRLTVVESPRVPLRHQVGLSLANTQEPAPQLGVFVDGDAMTTITRAASPARLAYLDRSLSALPYAMLAHPRVLVLGAGGSELPLARRHARRIAVADADARRLRLPCDAFRAYAGPVCAGVHLHAVAPRAFVRTRAQACARDMAQCVDLVVIAGEESLTGASAGVQATSEQFALTVQAFADDLRVLAPGGLVLVTRYSKQPPRDELKLWWTLVAALRDTGVDDPRAHLFALRGWDASVLVAARDPLTPRQREAARTFADAQGFDIAYPASAGAAAAEAAAPDALATGLAASPPASDPLATDLSALLADDAGTFGRTYAFDIAPATDDAPFFADYFRWRSFPTLWRLRDAGGAVLLDSGHLLLLAALAQALPLALVLVVLPLLGASRAHLPPPAMRRRVMTYFVALGLAFLTIEIACLSRLALLVGHALTATAVGLGGFLLFAGLGSLAAQRVGFTAARAVVAIALGLAWHVGLVAALQGVSATWPLPMRAAAGLASIAPLAFAMGVPFPLGLSRLAREAPALVPWAWALNGFASVVAAIAALLLAMAVGLQATLLVALALYGVAALAWPASLPR